MPDILDNQYHFSFQNQDRQNSIHPRESSCCIYSYTSAVVSRPPCINQFIQIFKNCVTIRKLLKFDENGAQTRAKRRCILKEYIFCLRIMLMRICLKVSNAISTKPLTYQKLFWKNPLHLCRAYVFKFINVEYILRLLLIFGISERYTRWREFLETLIVKV